MGSLDPFPYEMKAPDDVREPFRSVLPEVLAKCGEPRLLLHAPAWMHVGIRRRARFPATVLGVTDQGLVVLSDAPDERTVSVQYCPYAAVTSLELGTILLSSWMEVRFAEREQEMALARVEFNSVSDKLYHRALNMALERIRRNDGISRGDAPCRSDRLLADLPYKTGNDVRSWLPAGDALVALLYQPAMLRRPWKLFWAESQPISLLALSHRTLFRVSEEPARLAGLMRKQAKHGSIARYYPPQRITVPRLIPQDDEWQIRFESVAGGAVEPAVLAIEPDRMEMADHWIGDLRNFLRESECLGTTRTHGA